MVSSGKSDYIAVSSAVSQDGSEADKHYDDIGAKFANFLQDGYTKEEEKKLRWKIDMFLMPFLWLNVTFAAMDKVSHSTGALYGLREDLNLVGNEYSWIGSSFYFGYLCWCFPTGLILQKLPIAKVVGTSFFVWGAIIIGSGFAQNFKTMVACRVLLGFLEAPVVVSNLLIVSMWYTREEQVLRTGLFYTGLSTVFTGSIGYAVGGYTNTSYELWRYFFWIVGSISAVYGILVVSLLPDSPVSCRYLSDREKAIAIDRVRKNQTGIKNNHFKSDQFWQTFKDPKVWVMFAFQIFISIPNGGLTNFHTLILQGMGWTGRESCLLSIPNGLMQTISSYVTNFSVFFLAKYWPTKQVRGMMIIICLVPPFIATGVLYKLPPTDYIGRLVSLYFGFFYLGPYILSLNLLTSNTAGFTRKVTVNAIMFIAYAVSNIIGPFFWLLNQAPYYTLGVASIFVAYALSIASILVYMFLCWKENSKRDKMVGIEESQNRDTDLKDLTDIQNIHFRYRW